MKPILCATVAAAVLLAWHASLDSVPMVGDLSGPWEFALGEGPPSQWESIDLPGDLPSNAKTEFRNWVQYRKQFATPAQCSTQQCALVFGEIGDAVEISLNGQRLTRRGEFPPNAQYEKNYPVELELPAAVLRADGLNELNLKVYAFKFHQAGPRKGPVGLVDVRTGRSYARTKIFCTVFLPLACSFGLALLALTSFFWRAGREGGNDATEKAFQIYCITTAVFMASFSEIPRQYLPVSMAVPLHFLVRYASDWALYRLVSAKFRLAGGIWRLWNALYIVGLMPYLAILLFATACHSVFPEQVAAALEITYDLVDISFPLMLIGPIAGAIACFKQRPRHWASAAMGFALVGAFFFHDYLVCVTAIQGEYISKFQQLLLAVAFAAAIMRRNVAHEVRSETLDRAAVEMGNLAAQVAHDVRSPLAALRMVAGTMNDVDEERRLLVRHAVDRIGDICDMLLQKHRQAGKNDMAAAQPCGLLGVLEAVVAESRSRWLHRGAGIVQLIADDSIYEAFCAVEPSQLAAVVANLINNAVESLTGTGQVAVSVDRKGQQARIKIVDTGSGMPQHILDQVGQRGFTSGKKDGNGLGVFGALEFARAAGGDLAIKSKVGRGTTVLLSLPLVAPPSWFLPKLEVPRDATIVVLDDDKSIHAVWKRRLLGTDSRLVHLTSGHELRGYMARGQAQRYLVDFDMPPSGETGLQLIKDLGIGADSILVTSHAADPEVQRQCVALGVRLVAKSMVTYLPVQRAA